MVSVSVSCLRVLHHRESTFFPYTTLFRSRFHRVGQPADRHRCGELPRPPRGAGGGPQRVSRRRRAIGAGLDRNDRDRKSTRLNSSHITSSYAVFCLTKKTARILPVSSTSS